MKNDLNLRDILESEQRGKEESWSYKTRGDGKDTHIAKIFVVIDNLVKEIKMLKDNTI